MTIKFKTDGFEGRLKLAASFMLAAIQTLIFGNVDVCFRAGGTKNKINTIFALDNPKEKYASHFTDRQG